MENDVYKIAIEIIVAEVNRIKDRVKEDLILLDDIRKLDTLLKCYTTATQEISKSKKPILEDRSEQEIKELLLKAMEELDTK